VSGSSVAAGANGGDDADDDDGQGGEGCCGQKTHALFSSAPASASA